MKFKDKFEQKSDGGKWNNDKEIISEILIQEEKSYPICLESDFVEHILPCLTGQSNDSTFWLETLGGDPAWPLRVIDNKTLEEVFVVPPLIPPFDPKETTVDIYEIGMDIRNFHNKRMPPKLIENAYKAMSRGLKYRKEKDLKIIEEIISRYKKQPRGLNTDYEQAEEDI